MANDEKNTEAPQAEAPAERPLQVWADRVNRDIDEFIAAGLKPLPVLAMILLRRGFNLFDQLRVVAANKADDVLSHFEGKHAKSDKK